MSKTWAGSTRAATLPPNWRTTIRPAVLERDSYLCQLRIEGCMTIATDVDHIGDRTDHRIGNLQAACSPCNQRKNIATRPRPASRRRPAERHPGLH